MDLVISCMALAKPPAGLVFPQGVQVLHWMPPVEAGKHPSWTPQADAWRDPPYRKGRLLPNLLKQYGLNLESFGRLAAFGFSAGANNGLRELLRNQEDRESFDAVFSVDGLHPNLRLVPAGTGPRAKYAAWDQEMEPFADFATAAAFGERLAVFTASDVAAPSLTNAKTASALLDLVADVQARLPPEVKWTGPIVPAEAFPTSPSSPKPIHSAGSRNLSVWWYAGADKAAHIAQGKLVTADLWRDFLAYRWGASAPAAEPAEPSPPGPVAIRPISTDKKAAPRARAGAGTVAGVIGAFAIAGGLAGYFAGR